LQSLAGIWLTLFLMQHLGLNALSVVNPAAFIRGANWLEGMPYLRGVEVLLLAVPFAVHMVWGVWYALQAKFVGLPLERNRAFEWQRITSWVLLVGVIVHVIQMRFMDRPMEYQGVFLVPDGGGVASDFGTAELLMLQQVFSNIWWCMGYTVFVLAAAWHGFNGLWSFLIKWGVIETSRAFRGMAVVAWGLSVLFGLLGLCSVWLNYV
jgi:succinate dehydrogenase / fumarate reductase cytochrome b subunit